MHEGCRYKLQSICARDLEYKTSTSTVRIEMIQVEICPVRALAALIKARKDFKGTMFTITVEQARKVLQVLAAHVTGLLRAGFGLHSLRSGAACSADEAGVNLTSIVFLGRLRSAAVLCYLRSGLMQYHNGRHDGAEVLLGKRAGQGTRKGETRGAMRL